MAENDKQFGPATNKMVNTLDAGIEGVQKAVPKVKRGALDALEVTTINPDKLGENIRKGASKVAEWFSKSTPKKEEDKP